MPSLIKTITDKVIIPTLQAGVFYGAGSYAGIHLARIIPAPADLLSPVIGIGLGLVWLASQMGQHKRWAPRFNALTSGLQPDLNRVNLSTTVILTSNMGRNGDFYRLPGVDHMLLRRVAWHVCFMGGRLSHDYLDVKTGLLSRTEVTKFQKALISGQLARLRNPKQPGGGVLLTETGLDAMLSLARVYHPTPAEKIAAAPTLKGWSVAYMHRTYITGVVDKRGHAK